MGFEPQKLFVGLIDFFSVLLPGAALAYLTRRWDFSGTEQSTVFLFVSYLAGHAIFLVAAYLDSLLYDRIRTWTGWGQTVRLSNGKPLLPRWRRRLAGLLFPSSPDAALIQVMQLKARVIGEEERGVAINAFQWAKARLTRDLPEGLLAVHRFEASSKFFRSFAVVLVILCGYYAAQSEWKWAGASALAIFPALGRYLEQRYKSTQQAYWFLLTLESPPPAPPRADGLTHAGGLVTRSRDGRVEYLLVQASQNRAHWVLPKGHVEPGETPRIAAVREVEEEAGYWARITGWVADETLVLPETRLAIRWFRMELEEQSRGWQPENRERLWLPLEQAIEQATFAETRALLRKASAPATN